MKLASCHLAIGAFVGVGLALGSCSSAKPGGGEPDASSFCTDDDQCPVGQLCLGGFCQEPLDGGMPPDAPPGPPEIVVDPTMLDFGSALLDVEVSLTVEIANVGESPLQVTSLQLVESDSLPEYGADPLGPVTLEIAPGASSMVTVTLRQQDDEVDVGELRIASNDGDEPVTVVALVSDIKGTPQLTVTPAAIDYGTVDWGTAPTEDVDVTNSGTGNAPLVVTAASVTDDTGLGGVYTPAAFLVDPTTGAELSVTLPVFLARADGVTPGDLLRVRLTLDTTPLGSGTLPAEDLVLMTNDIDPADAEKHVPIGGEVLGCAAPDAEVCDGADNDCDLLVDEDDPGGGVGCFTGTPGECADGLLHCVGGSLVCQDTGGPVAEVCDGLDNDCDGSADEALVQTCTTACGMGVEFCVGGAWAGCNAPAPQPETCDGYDNDCDGSIDEGDPGSGSPCTTGQPGVCNPGTIHCVGGALTCQRNMDPSPEACDGEDDDCDNQVDEGFGLGTACDGADGDLCNEGVLVCDGTGAGTTCTDATAGNVEACNGADDDCDGTVDEGFTLGAACDGGDADLCTEGVTICNGTGTGTTCNDASSDNVELCNGADDDCDGTTDEGYDLGVACDGTDTDLCTEGLTVCNTAGTGTTCNDTTGPNPETCNGLDDDCDGTTDEGFTLGTACDGGDADGCAEGVTVCNAAGTGTTCNDATGDNAEVCNGSDDDCDGSTDEGFGLGVACDGADADGCNEGVTICNTTGTGTQCNDTTGDNAEVCNGSDDDCDGSTDEGFVLGAACDGADGDLCAEGVTVCNGTGTGTICNDTSPNNVEFCNDTDDDCDGSTDEGYALGVACDGGDTDLCPEGFTVCNGAGTGTECNDATGNNGEACNGADDDCDGTTDEGYSLGVACDGSDGDLCAEGITVCNSTGTGTQCNDTSGTNTEVCDGTDNDCDGTNNEGYALGVACDGGDGDLCNEGVTVCNAAGTGTECNDATATNTETCNSADDDCDGTVDEGYALGVACDGGDTDLCAEGLTVCNSAGTGTQCNDLSGNNTEFCNAADDDCDGLTDEGYALGVACDGGDGDACAEGVTVCNGAGTGTECNDATGTNSETCNGLDDDCDTSIDEGFTLGVACDGSDADLCNEGVTVCKADGTGTQCDDPNDADPERCDGTDNDCDGTNNEGFSLGVTCDGGDGDLCAEGVTVCSGDGLSTVCNDATTTNVELCDSTDNDCDGTNNEGFSLGVACDGTDADLCNEGTTVCSGDGSTTVCNDPNDVDVELCDSVDNDCDGTNNEGYALGGACDGTDGDFCPEGTMVCNVSGTGTVCNDATGTNEELCDGTDNDCDGTNNEGFDLANDVNNCGACGNVCNVPNALETCSSYACGIAACTGGYVNTDGAYGTGCECLDDGTEAVGGDGCGAAIDIGILYEWQAATRTAKIATAGDEDWYQVTFIDTYGEGDFTCDAFLPQVTFDSNPGDAYRFDIYNTGCAAVCGGNFTQFQNWTGWYGAQCCANEAEGWRSPGWYGCEDDSVTFRVRVVRTSGATCEDYVLRFSNG